MSAQPGAPPKPEELEGPVGPLREEDLRDLGFGAVVASESRLRLLNRDGTFNVDRRGRGFFASISPYHTLLTMTWRTYFGLVGFALAAGILFARFSRPLADIVFSEYAIVAPYRDMRALEFRIANRRTNEVLELQAQVLFSRLEGPERVRRFYPLSLERQKVVFFPLTWTVVHPIDGSSPIRGLTHQNLVESDAEILILLTGIDETFSQTVQARSSYKPQEIVWNARFTDIYRRPRDGGLLSVDVGRINEIERLSPTE